MSKNRVLWALVIVTAFFGVTCVYGGPARGLVSGVPAKAIKIPRSIRAPFRNNEIMTARGFGKRSQEILKIRDGNRILIK